MRCDVQVLSSCSFPRMLHVGFVSVAAVGGGWRKNGAATDEVMLNKGKPTRTRERHSNTKYCFFFFCIFVFFVAFF
jgi:hypothetical protein